ncbi:MAG: esterase family protein [Sphingomonadales bacterium]|nr:esterase family protein [Sphingomonadales bacterium]
MRFLPVLPCFALLAVLTGCVSSDQRVDAGAGGVRFEISIDPAAVSGPVDGRVLLMLSRTEAFNHWGIQDGSPIFGVGVNGFAAGDVAVIDASTPGQPVASIADFPPGDYFVQAYLNLYTTFHRADGHVVKLHMDQGEGQQWHLSPGNLHSTPKKIAFDPSAGGTIPVVLDQVIPPIAAPEDTEWVRNIRIESARVSAFWGRPMHLGARVLLPKGYAENPDARYPLVIWHGHFSADNPGGFKLPGEEAPDEEAEGAEEDEGVAFYKLWTSDDFPRFLLATIQHPTPYYDDSYAVNSANMGPYGDAVNYELLPEIEARFRAIGAPYARILTGCSTGGWEALANQVWYPDLYGGAWVFAPDQVDFHYYELVNLYEPEKNAYYQENEWSKIPLPAHRQPDGRPVFTNIQENLREEVIGTRYRSGGQWAAWNALFAPVAEDGYPKPIWDPWTGVIDPEVAQWAIDRYDIVNYLRNNWQTVGPKLAGKLNFFTGRMDNWYIEQAIYLLEDFLAETENPHVPGRFEYGVRAEHCWNPWEEADDPGGLFREIAAHVENNRPK